MTSSPQRTPEESLRLAEKVLLFSRRYITQKAPLMLVPIYALRQEPLTVPAPMATDGVHLFFSPEQVIADFQRDRCAPARQLLHVTLHCLLGHLPLRPREERLAARFDCIADLKAAQFADALSPDFFPPGNTLQLYQHLPLAALDQRLERNAEQHQALKGTLQKRKLHLDDHSLWNPSAVRSAFGLSQAGGEQDGQASDSSPQSLSPGAGGGEDSGPDWKGMLQDLAQRAQNGPDWGSVAGLLQEEYLPSEENSISYSDFLRRFVVPEERLLLDPDSFDLRWYCLGMELYGDIPLLEPSELSEPPLPDDIVLALDTSGSCSGEVCSRFLRETLSLLRDITAGASRFHILALQCDTEIQREIFLESPDQLDHFLEDFAPSGFGSTDFCPVFQRVEALRKEGKLPRVRGLLYLSDGYGSYPDDPPDYPVTFLLPGEDCSWRPDWVSALLFNTDDFTLKEASV